MPVMGLAAADKTWQWVGSWRSGRLFDVCDYCGAVQDCRRNHRRRGRSGSVGQDFM